MTTPAAGTGTGRVTGTAWSDLTDRLWNRTPGTVALDRATANALDPARAYAAVVTASAPFRDGTRARAAPDVRFEAPGGLLRAPGERLPGPADGTLTTYRARLRDRGDLPGWLVSVRHALLVDAELWARVRDLVSGLWRRVGWPVVPVRSELTLGHRFRPAVGSTPGPDRAELLFVLTGGVTVRLWRQDAAPSPAPGPADGGAVGPGGGATTGRPAAGAVDVAHPVWRCPESPAPEAWDPSARAPEWRPPDRELRAHAGELVYRPTGYWSRLTYGPDCLLLRLEVGGDHGAAVAVVREALAETARHAPGYRAGEVPWLPFPGPVGTDGASGTAPPVAACGLLFTSLAAGPEVERVVRAGWAARRSAAGLEPVPAQRGPDTALRARRFRVTSEIVRGPDGPGGALWAVNGHLLPVSGSVAETVRHLLSVGRELTVAEVCAAVGARDGHPAVVGLLDRLHRMRGIEPATSPVGAP